MVLVIVWVKYRIVKYESTSKTISSDLIQVSTRNTASYIAYKIKVSKAKKNDLEKIKSLLSAETLTIMQ